MDLTFNGRHTCTVYVWDDAFITRIPAVAKKLCNAEYYLQNVLRIKIRKKAAKSRRMPLLYVFFVNFALNLLLVSYCDIK